MPDFKLGFESNFVSAVEFGGKEPTLTIESITLEELADDSGRMKKRWIGRFVGKQKAWVMNRTNCELLAALFGSRETNDWIGKRVTLASETVYLKGAPVPGIRVKGSPDLKQPLEVSVKLPKKKASLVRLIPTVAKGPGSNVD